MKLIRLATLIAVTLAQPLLAEVSKERTAVLNTLKSAGIPVGEIVEEKRTEGTPLPNCYAENFSFALPSVAPKGGQIFICTKKAYGDALVAYFKKLEAIAGPYVYQSKDGKVVAQMTSSLPVADAEKVEAAFSELRLP